MQALLTDLCPAVAGLYLHGSCCLDAFVPGQSDLDLLVVTDAPMDRAARVRLADGLLPLHEAPCPVELSVVRRADAARLPVLCQFHFSSLWAPRYQAHDEANPLLASDFPDGDMPAYFRLIREKGVVLAGAVPAALLPTVSDEAFWASITEGIEAFQFPDYGLFDANILTLGRIVSFAHTRRILSKAAGAKWAAARYPQFAGLLGRAVEAYTHAAHGSYDPAELAAYRAWMLAEIRQGLR